MSYQQPPPYNAHAPIPPQILPQPPMPHQQPGAPYLHLVGPDSNRILARINPNGSRTPLFAVSIAKSKPQIQISRILPNQPLQPISSGVLSSWSGTMRLSLPNLPELKLLQSYEGMQYNIYFDHPQYGRLTWRPTRNANGMELWDAQKTKLAWYKYYKSEPELLVFVPVDPALLDLIVTAAIAIMVDDRKGLEMVGKIMKIAA